MRKRDKKRLEKIIKSCKKCGGTGVTETLLSSGDLQLDDCKCSVRAAEEASMIDAAIPEKYRDWDLRKLKPEFKKKNEAAVKKVKKYIDNLEENVATGTGLWLCSTPGLAKSSIICHILKKAIRKNITAYFLKSSKAINLKFDTMRNDQTARGILRHIEDNVEILAFEEIEKVYLLGKTAIVTQHFYDFISDVYDANIAMLISSNTLREEFEPKLPTFIRDRLRNTITIPFYGPSCRENEE